jgi:hypothetical protein
MSGIDSFIARNATTEMLDDYGTCKHLQTNVVVSDVVTMFSGKYNLSEDYKKRMRVLTEFEKSGIKVIKAQLFILVFSCSSQQYFFLRT